jgi:hypothetical protein
MGTIEKFSFEFILVNPIHLVLKPRGTFRLVTDCAQVNKFMKPTHLEMEEFKDLVEKNENVISFYLKGYNHVPVHNSVKNLLRMCWNVKSYLCLEFRSD